MDPSPWFFLTKSEYMEFRLSSVERQGAHEARGVLLRLELALVFPEEKGMMQQSSVSISLSF